MDVREKLVELIRKGARGHTLMPTESIANYLVEHGVKVKEWISVNDRLPEEDEYVMIWCGECQIARIKKGISEEQRKAMKRGELDDPCEIGWTLSSGYFTLKRSQSYKACDEQ